MVNDKMSEKHSLNACYWTEKDNVLVGYTMYSGPKKVFGHFKMLKEHLTNVLENTIVASASI